MPKTEAKGVILFIISMPIHNFDARKSKQCTSFKRVSDATLGAIGEVDQHPTGEGSDGQATVVVDSPEMGFHAQSASETAPLVNLRDVPLTHEEVREGTPSGQITSRPDKATSSRSGRRPLLLDRLLLYSYIPPQVPAPHMGEVLAPWPEGTQEIINRWNPFNQGEAPTTHLEQLYPVMLRMLVKVLAEGKGEKYVIPIPAYACKEDLKQAVDDGMLIHNHNFF